MSENPPSVLQLCQAEEIQMLAGPVNESSGMFRFQVPFFSSNLNTLILRCLSRLKSIHIIRDNCFVCLLLKLYNFLFINSTTPFKHIHRQTNIPKLESRSGRDGRGGLFASRLSCHLFLVSLVLSARCEHDVATCCNFWLATKSSLLSNA